MIRAMHGNLLADDADALVNTVNTVGVMGKGIALQFKRAYPEMFTCYAKAAKRGEIQPGRVHVWQTEALSGPQFIINFPTKRHWKAPARLEDVEAGLEDLVRVVRDLEISSIAIPPLGAGLGGLDWEHVSARIRAAFAPLEEGVDVRVYEPAGAPAARDIVTRTAAPRLTAVRAALLHLMSAYHEASWAWPSPIEIQKLAYFLQEAGEPLRLEYAKAPYGPYADALRKTLRELEGHYILGYGDGTARPLDAGPIEVTVAAKPALRGTAETSPGTTEHLHKVLDLISGFEGTYDLELLASVHWAATHEGAMTPTEASMLIRRWTARKATLFGVEDVRIAWTALDQGGWMRIRADA